MATAGTTVGGRYQLIRVIGAGGMSTVWLAMDETLGKQWAVKEIRLSDDPAEREIITSSFVAEANLIKRFDHVAIPRIVDLVDEGGTLYVVMDYVEGRSLESLLSSEGPQAEEDVVDWAIQLCDVLDYLHQLDPPIVYCDLKPSNVMLRPDGTMRLIDFGIARPEGSAHEAEQAGRRLGTKGYAAPEQYGGSGIDRRCDVFSLGATAYALLTGTRPTPDAGELAPLRQVRPELSVGIERVVTRAMAADPSDRYAGAAEMAYALERYKVDDDVHRRGLARKWHAFTGVLVAAATCLVLGLSTWVARNIVLEGDFDHWMQVADQSVDQGEASAAYARAATILPADTRPYDGLFRLYREDGVFTSEEEEQFEQVVMPNLAALRSDARSWSAFAFETGKLYWYYYDNTDGTGPTGNAGYARMRAASRWMHEASEGDFDESDLATAYADIADFACDIVPRIDEGSDAGLYAPHFERLRALVAQMEGSGNAVMRLDAAGLALDALRAYPRKFRADGISREDMLELVTRADALAASVVPTSDQQDADQARIVASAQQASTSVSNAFIDVGRMGD